MVGVIAHLGGKVERRRKPHLPRGQQLPETLVGLLRGSETGILPHGPEPAGVHVGVDAAGKGELAREPEVMGRIAGPVLGTVQLLHGTGWEIGSLLRLAARRRASATNPTSSREPMTNGVR